LGILLRILCLGNGQLEGNGTKVTQNQRGHSRTDFDGKGKIKGL